MIEVHELTKRYGNAAAVDGQPYQRLSRPLHQAGALLDAGAVHGGRTARDHPRSTIIHALPSPWHTRIGRFTLDGAAQQVIARHPHPGYFPAGPSFLIAAGYAAVAIAAAAFIITRRDA